MQEGAVAESEEVAETYEFEAEVAKVIRPLAGRFWTGTPQTVKIGRVSKTI